MSEIEDSQNASEQVDTQNETTETAEVSSEVVSTIEESEGSELSEKSSTKKSEEEGEEIKEKEQEEIKEKEREEIKEAEATPSCVTPSREETQEEETSVSELATITRSASSDDGVPVLGVAAKQAEPDVGVPSATTIDDENGQQRRVSGDPNTIVGEWNSLPILVERLREALELSLAAGCRRSSDEPTATSLIAPGIDRVGDQFWVRRSMEQALLGSDHDYNHDVSVSRKDELKFLEDLLLSDIQTALSHLRETLERTDVATLAKHGGVSDPTSKLHLLRLVSSLLSRLQVPVEERESVNNKDDKTADVAAQGGSVPPGRKRRPVRHTIGVSAEEIAHARKKLEDSKTDLAKLNEQIFLAERPESLLSVSRNVTSNERSHVEEINDKYTKDVINQRQSLRDRNKDISVYRPLIPPQINYEDRLAVVSRTDESNTCQTQHRNGIDGYQEKVSDDEETAIKRASEEQSQVTKLAAALRQRAELISAGKCNNNNKFAAKKSKIKRANTVDIPSYLKLQANSFGYDNPGCALRRPINVGDKITANASNLGVPSFQPKTENDKKFLALINRNNETQAYNAVPAFVKSFGYTKTTEMSRMNENWNSRFSNIKTAFDKSSSANDTDKLSPRLQNVAKRFPDMPSTSPQVPASKKTSTDGSAKHNSLPFANANVPQSDAGFRHAPSSLFRKIEKPLTPKSPPGHHWQRDNASPSGNSLREKAKIFDRDTNQSQSSSFNVNENIQKSIFPRPPWIEHDRNEGKSNNKMVTENGRLDYRLFCKQFAPFIGKNAVPEAKSIEDSRRRNEHLNAHHKNLIPLNEKLDIVDGKISFNVFSEKESEIQYRPSEPYRAVEKSVRDKFDVRSEKDVFKSLATVRNDKDSFGTTFAENVPIDAIFKGSSSVAVQTGINDDSHPEETRVFRVVPTVAKRLPSTYNNVAVQTNEPKVEAKEYCKTLQYHDIVPISDLIYHPVADSNHFVLDHNRNYHAVTTDITSRNEALVNKNACNFIKEDIVPYSTEKVPFQISDRQLSEQREPVFQTNSQCENYFLPKSPIDNRSQIYPTYIPYVKSNKDPFEDRTPSVSHEINKENFLCTSDSALPEEQNIQNQDISSDTGVVTRYTCAIATVASDNPLAQIDKTRLESGTSPSSSLSSSPFWSQPKSISSETITTEDEIRRHNMLQQNLVRQLQNERAMLNDHHTSVGNKSSNFNQPNSSFHQSNSFNQPLKFQPPEAPKRLELSKIPEPPKKPELLKKPEPPRRSELSKKFESSRRLEPPRKLEPPAVITGLLSVTPSSGIGAKNRITALRKQYEQPGNQSRPIQKERSPIPNGASSTMDSSDEYLVSCTNKPFRSIVLSKSESWHQLALSKGQHAPSRPGKLSSQPLDGTGSYLPKPPKPRSPSSFKMKKQFEASSDSVKKMEDKIRRYFDNPANDGAAETRDPKGRRFSSRDSTTKTLVSLSRSRTMPGICDESLRLTIPTVPQIPVANLNSAEVDRVFDDIFEEATRIDDHHF